MRQGTLDGEDAMFVLRSTARDGLISRWPFRWHPGNGTWNGTWRGTVTLGEQSVMDPLRVQSALRVERVFYPPNAQIKWDRKNIVRRKRSAKLRYYPCCALVLNDYFTLDWDVAITKSSLRYKRPILPLHGLPA